MCEGRIHRPERLGSCLGHTAGPRRPEPCLTFPLYPSRKNNFLYTASVRESLEMES